MMLKLGIAAAVSFVVGGIVRDVLYDNNGCNGHHWDGGIKQHGIDDYTAIVERRCLEDIDGNAKCAVVYQDVQKHCTDCVAVKTERVEHSVTPLSDLE